MELNRSHIPMLWGFFVISLLLHLLLLYLLPEHRMMPLPAREEPVVVEMRPPEPRERELDLPVPAKEKPRDTPAKRLGPADQEVQRETAPEGDVPEDRAPQAATPRPQPVPPPQKAKPSPSEVKPAPKPEPVQQAKPEPLRHEVSRPAPNTTSPPTTIKQESTETVSRPRNLPDLSTLTQLPATTIARLEDQWRSKYREDVEKGNAVWLDTERDILISFFQRLRDNIYGVWNYPPEAAARKQEGTCLLRITVNRDGTVKQVKLMESSGHRILDREAIAAVHKGAPYGDLPRAYTEEELNIFAFFQYTLTNRIVY